MCLVGESDERLRIQGVHRLTRACIRIGYSKYLLPPTHLYTNVCHQCNYPLHYITVIDSDMHDLNLNRSIIQTQSPLISNAHSCKQLFTAL